MESWLKKTKSLSCWWEDPPSAAVVLFRMGTPGVIAELCVQLWDVAKVAIKSKSYQICG